MDALDLASFVIGANGTAKFEGGGNGSPVSFFVARNLPGTGAAKHRHPYVETFVILEGDIEIVLDDELSLVGAGHVVVVPAMAWHEFTVRGDHPALMVNIHPVPEILQENWV